MILSIYVEAKIFSMMKLSHAFMPSVCGTLLYNSIMSIEIGMELWDRFSV